MSWRPNNENSDSEDEAAGEYFGRQGREAFIYLVDAFLYRDQDLLQKCLECIRDSMLNSILSRDKDLIGLVFCNTEHSPEPRDKEGLENITIHKNNAMFLPLKQLSKSIVEYYLNFKNPDFFDFENRFGAAEGNFANTIWLCTNMLKHSGFKLQTSTIVFFTDRDSPHDPNSREYQLAIQKASDLQQIDVNFTVIPMKDDFDYEPFYKEFICTVREIDLDAFETPNPEIERTLITDRQIRQNFHKRCNNHLRFNISEGLELAVGVYNYYKRNVFPKSVKLLRKENSIIQMKYVNKIEVYDAETSEVISERYALPGDQKKCITVGGSKIYFTSDEAMKLKSPLAPGINLLGFKPRSILTITDYVKSSSFLYPDEKLIAGSTSLFRALWQKCIEKEKIAICTIVSRRKTAPRYVALVPTESNENNISSPMLNDGFRILYLPFEIDYRTIDLSNRSAPEVPAEGLELFQKICKKLKIKYTPAMFKDPALKLLYLNIVGLAFDIEEDDYNEGCTMPDVEMQDSRIQSYVDEMVQIFGTDLEISKKRKGDENNTDQRSKAQKVTEEVPSREQIDTLLASNTLDQLTVKQLRNYLRHNDVGGISSATKPALIEKVKELHT